MKKISRRELLKNGKSFAIASALGLQLIPFDSSGKSDQEKKLKIMVTGAHPDDPETGCGGTMALLAKEGHEVISVYLTKGEAGISGTSATEAAKIREIEANRACAILNAKPHFLGQVDGNTMVTKEWQEKVSAYIKKENPDIIFTHWPIDTHPDHQACSLLTYNAWLQTGKKAALYYYEVMSGSQTQNFAPTNFIDISEVLKTKHQACFIHQSQKIAEEYANDHGRMEIFRGMEFNVKYAEAFIRHHQNPRVIAF